MRAGNDLGSGRIGVLVGRIALPSMLAQFISVLYSIVDRIFIGQIPGEGALALAGAGVCGPVVTMVGSVAFLVGVGGAPLLSIKRGEGDDDAARGILANCFLMLCVFSVALPAAILPFLEPMLRLFGANDATYPYAEAYFTLYLLGTPFALLASGLNQFIVCQGFAADGMKSVALGAVLNIVLDPVFIFAFGLGVRGAAIATVLSRFVELFILVFVTHRNKLRFRFLEGAWRTMAVPGALTKAIMLRGMPLLLNECLWAIGQAKLSQLYSMRGLSVIAAFNISNTVADLFNVVFLSMGNAVAIMIGQALGANEYERAKREVWQLIALSVGCCVIMGSLLAIFSNIIPRLYNTTVDVRALAGRFLRISAAFMGVNAFANSSYFALRSGGKTLITFLFDSGFSWAVCVPVAAALIYWTNASISLIYAAVLATSILKCIFGFILIRKGVWIQNIVA